MGLRLRQLREKEVSELQELEETSELQKLEDTLKNKNVPKSKTAKKKPRKLEE
jgi:hypothetical protein